MCTYTFDICYVCKGKLIFRMAFYFILLSNHDDYCLNLYLFSFNLFGIVVYSHCEDYYGKGLM